MNEFNVRLDGLFQKTVEYNDMANIFTSLSSNLANFLTTTQTLSSKWKDSANMVYNYQPYWEEPISIVYKNTFNGVANFLEIETWLNDNFPTSNFISTQLIKCEYLCKNYSSESLKNRRVLAYDAEKMADLANAYSATTNDIFYFLGLQNQYNTLILLINSLLKKYKKKDYIIETYSDVDKLNTLISYQKELNLFDSDEFQDFNQIDLMFIHSYLYQHKIIKTKYDELVDRGFENIPNNVLLQFEPKNIELLTGGRFFFINLNNKWTYYPYTNIEFCTRDACSDCYDIISLDLYENNDCIPYKYILTECDYYSPYDEVVVPFEASALSNSISNLLS